jgi:hypothetical protein
MKSNKLISAVIVLILGGIILTPIIVFLFVLGTVRRGMMSYGGISQVNELSVGDYGGRGAGLKSYTQTLRDSAMPTPIPGGATPQPDVEERRKVRNATISLHVSNVRETVDSIGDYVNKIGGYVVTQSINTPSESSTGNMSIRVPTDELDATLEYLRERSVNVVYESVSGRDITDQYVDTQAKLETLEKTKAIFESMLDETEDFDEILRAQKEILNVQRQIDNVKGQIEYMEGTSETALIRINLSTDALELGYAPKNAWRPKVVFKKAVRSMLVTMRGLGNLAIWLGVYSVFWLPPVIIVILLVRKAKRKKKNSSKK